MMKETWKLTWQRKLRGGISMLTKMIELRVKESAGKFVLERIYRSNGWSTSKKNELLISQKISRGSQLEKKKHRYILNSDCFVFFYP